MQRLAIVQQARIAAGVTQGELAERLGRPQSFVSKCESGERRVDMAEFLAICQAIQTVVGGGLNWRTNKTDESCIARIHRLISI